MQRLFSMFPRGAPGLALVILRLAVAANLWPVGTLALLLEIPLCLGLLTPAVAAVCAALHVARLFGSDAPQILQGIVAIANASALALLGPGGYSIDSRLFGRRVFVVSSGGDGA